MTTPEKLNLISRISLSEKHVDPIGDIMKVCRSGEPKIVCLCGSTRFWKTFQEQSLQLTKEGFIVLSIGSATASDAEHGITEAQKTRFDMLHKKKIDLCDQVLVLNVGGYIGESTRSEIDYAIHKQRPVAYLEPIPVYP